MFNAMIEVLKANPRKIVFTEGPDPRILEATDRLKKGGFLTPILIGEVEAVKAAAAAGNFDVEGVEIIDPATYPEMDAMVEKMVALRKGKMTAEDCRKALSKGNYFGTMLVKMGYADALLGGATYSTADTVRPALQLVKTKAGAHLVSSCFILVRGEEKLSGSVPSRGPGRSGGNRSGRGGAGGVPSVFASFGDRPVRLSPLCHSTQRDRNAGGTQGSGADTCPQCAGSN